MIKQNALLKPAVQDHLEYVLDKIFHVNEFREMHIYSPDEKIS